MSDDSEHDPLLNPGLRWVCQEDPMLELAVREMYPAAGGGDQEWLRRTELLARRAGNRRVMDAAASRMRKMARECEITRAMRALDALEASESEARDRVVVGGDPLRWLH